MMGVCRNGDMPDGSVTHPQTRDRRPGFGRGVKRVHGRAFNTVLTGTSKREEDRSYNHLGPHEFDLVYLFDHAHKQTRPVDHVHA
jgi:hypothetical protein